MFLNGVTVWPILTFLAEGVGVVLTGFFCRIRSLDQYLAEGLEVGQCWSFRVKGVGKFWQSKGVGGYQPPRFM